MKHPGQTMVWLILLTMAAVFLAALGAMTVQNACRIRDQLLEEVSLQFSENAQEFNQVLAELPEDVSAGEAWNRYLMMLSASDADHYGFDITATGFYVGETAEGLTFLGGRNMMAAQLYGADGSITDIPITFPADNTTDVAELFQELDSGYTKMTDGVILEGYWQDGLFYIQYLEGAADGYPLIYLNYAETPEDAEPFTVSFSAHGEDAYTRLTLTPVDKDFGKTGYTADYLARWEAIDRLTAEVQASFTLSQRYTGMVSVESSLFRVKQVGTAAGKNRGKTLGTGNTVNYVYAVTFSPLQLSIRSEWSDGTLLLLAVVFLAAILLLLYESRRLRRAELRAYRDEINQKQQALNYAQDAEKSRREMTSVIAHELKTPVAVLSSYAEAIQENIDPKKQGHYMEVIQEETGLMDQMVMELLDLSRLEAGRYKPKREDFDLEQLVRGRVNALGSRIAEKNLEISWQVGNPIVNADRYRMGQVAENFMTNAIRHTPPGGKIVIRIGTPQETFSVENQGKPIPTENLPKVWETFWQGDAARNEKGSGLGLSICRTIVTLHGGSRKAENTGIGVRFSVSLEKEKKLFQLGRMPQEETVCLEYPIAVWYTNVGRVMKHLGLLGTNELRREIREGSAFPGTSRIRSRRTRLYPGCILIWKEFRITICLQEDLKRRAMLVERMNPGSGLCANDRTRGLGQATPP